MTRPLEKSKDWWRRAEQVIPLGTQTLSKSPTQFVQGMSPIYLQCGLGSHVWDVDGNEFVDYPMALGPVLLGYGDPVVDDAIRAQLDQGITFTLMHPLEVEVAERIVAMCPGVEAVRFGKTGSDAVSGAVRAARAHTGRDHILVAGYHGWHDWYIGTTTRNRGVPEAVRELTSTFPYNDIAALDRALSDHRGDVAAVVLEPSGLETPGDGYLQEVVAVSHRHGAVVIFDEIITGFRRTGRGEGALRRRSRSLLLRQGAWQRHACVAVAGSWEVMQAFEDVFFSGTHGGETLSLAAARAVLDIVADGRILAGIGQLGARLMAGMQAAVDAHGVAGRVRVGGEPPRTVVAFSGADQLVVRSWVQQQMVEAGILFNGSMFICARHSDEDVDRALAAFDGALAELAAEGDVAGLLGGPPVQAVFRTP